MKVSNKNFRALKRLFLITGVNKMINEFIKDIEELKFKMLQIAEECNLEDSYYEAIKALNNFLSYVEK